MFYGVLEFLNALLLSHIFQSLLDARLDSADFITAACSLVLVLIRRMSVVGIALILDVKVFKVVHNVFERMLI